MTRQDLKYIRECWSQMKGLRESLDRLSENIEAIRNDRDILTPKLEQRLMSLKETAKYLGMSVDTVKRLKTSRQIPWIPFGSRSVRVDRLQLDKWLEKYSSKMFWDNWKRRGFW